MLAHGGTTFIDIVDKKPRVASPNHLKEVIGVTMEGGMSCGMMKPRGEQVMDIVVKNTKGVRLHSRSADEGSRVNCCSKATTKVIWLPARPVYICVQELYGEQVTNVVASDKKRV